MAFVECHHFHQLYLRPQNSHHWLTAQHITEDEQIKHWLGNDSEDTAKISLHRFLQIYIHKFKLIHSKIKPRQKRDIFFYSLT